MAAEVISMEQARIVRGGACSSLVIVVRHLARLANTIATAPTAESVRTLGLAIAALTDIRDALREAGE